MPITDFDSVWQRPGDMPSQIDVFNDDAIANRAQDQAEYIQQLSEGLSAADRHKFGTGRPEELEIDLAKEFEKMEEQKQDSEPEKTDVIKDSEKTKPRGKKGKKRDKE